MSRFLPNFYARHRLGGLETQTLREDDGSPPPERLLQAIWQQQRILRDDLRTLDGQRVRILHPGFKNHEAGPDFRGAVIKIGDEPPQTGDVEIDLVPGGWRAHGHDRNPAFKGVVLQVIWDGGRPVAGELPVMALRGKLDAPLGELNMWLGGDSLKSLPENLRGQCSAPLRDLPPGGLAELLHQAAEVRWRNKAAHFQARARQAGWEQALWEGIFRALGYKQNTWPMQALGEARERWLPRPAGVFECQARLFGVSGLLPVELSRAKKSADGYLSRLWDQWWREREQFDDCTLPREAWRFNSLRPANHPQRRLALAAHWLAAGDFTARLEKWFLTPTPDADLSNSLLQTIQVEPDEFWSSHWTFRSARLANPQPLLGAARVTDLAVNVILPWFWTRASEGGAAELRERAEHRYLAWPAAEDNSLLRLARQRLLDGTKPAVLKGAAAQQGLLQILRDFCDHSNALCANCPFPELVRAFRNDHQSFSSSSSAE